MIKSYSLTPENVDVISDVVARYIGKYNMPKKDVIRGRLAVESVLLFDMLITAVNEVSSVNNLVNSAYVMGMIKRR